MDNKFINRTSEREEFRHLLQNTSNINKVIILYADMGVGKSDFTQKVLDEQKSRIPLKIKRDDLSYNDLSYIKKIIEVIDGFAQKKKFDFITLESFIKKDRSQDENYNYKLFSQLVSSYKLLIPLKTIIERNLALGDYKTETILNGDEESLQILVNYLKHNLEKKQIVLNIENIQAIDFSSQKILLEILEYTKNCVYIFEYTTNAININVKKEILEEMCNRAQGCNVRLEKLKVIELKEILLPYIKPEMIKEFEFLIDNLKISYDGNITKIKNYVALLDKDNINHDIDGSTNKKINLLSSTEINLLCIISAYPSQLHIDTLREYFLSFNTNPFNDLDLLLDKLKDEFILEHNQIISLSDDTMRKILLTQNSYQRFLHISQIKWIEYYQNILRTNNYTFVSEIEVLTNLFYLYIKRDKKNVFNILERIKQVVIENYFTTKAIQLIETLSYDVFSYKFTEEETEIIQFTLIDLYYFLGFDKKGKGLVSQVKENSSKKTIYKIAFFNKLEDYIGTIDIIKKELKNTNLGISYELSLYLFLFITYHSVNNEDEAKKVRKILEKKKYYECYEYGFVLRNLQIGESYSKSLINIEKSIEHFLKTNSKVYEGHTRITKMMQLIRLGRLEEAEKELKLINSLLDKRSREKHYININKSVLKLYKYMLDSKIEHNFDEIEYDLNISLKITDKPYSKIVIYNNLLILYILKQDHENIENCISSLESLIENHPNRNLHKVVFSNIAKYYSFSDDYLHNLYLERARTSFNKFNAYWRYRLYNEEFEPNELEKEKYKFFKKFDYDLILTSYWHFDISKIQ